jgi:DNA polymerase-3 subunit beta
MSDTDTLDRPTTSTALRVDRDTLLAAVRAVSQTVERRNTIPILSNVLLRAENSFMTVAATDLDHLCQRVIDCAGEWIDTTVEADRLIGAIDTLRPGAIDMSFAAGALIIKQGRSTRKLMTLPSTDFPMIAPSNEGTTFAMDAAPLLRLLETARVSSSTEDAKYYMCGVFMQVVDGELIAAAADGYRVAQVRHPAPVEAIGAPDSLIGNKAVGLICRLLGDLADGAQVDITLASGRFGVTAGRSSIAGKLIEAAFPNYRRALRSGHTSSMIIQAAELDRSIRAAGSASDGKTRAVRLDLAVDHCEASGSAQDGGRSVEPMEGDYQGDAMQIGINLIYAASIVKMFGPAPKLSLGIGANPKDIIIITSDDRPGVTVGVMPMNA